MCQPPSRALTYVIHASASYFDHVVEETFSHTRAGPLQIGRAGALAVPVPAGAPYLARVEWTSRSEARVFDGRGRQHALRPDQDVVIEVGPVALRLTMVARFRLRRTGPFPWAGSTVWLVILLASSLLTEQIQTAWSLRCHTVPLWETYLPGRHPLWMAECFGDAGGASTTDIYTAEYLARLLERDYEGEDVGAITDEWERSDHEAERDDYYLPAGSLGPTDQMEGAEEVSVEPERTPLPVEPEDAGEAEQILVVDDDTEGPEVAAPEVDVGEGEEVVDAEDRAAEEEEGWGIPDWYDADDQSLDDLEIEAMLQYSKDRLRIDPNDPYALSVLSYYQYLAMDYESAEATYDRYIALLPDDPAGYNNKALIYKRTGDYAREERLYRVALALSPEDETALNNLAVNLAHQGRYDDALEIMLRLETLLPDDPYADLHRAKVHAARGDREIALAYLEKALAGMKALDTLHEIEFTQDIRVDPAFNDLRRTREFRAILWKYYGDATPVSLP